MFSSHSGFGGNILELKAAFVQIKLVPVLISSEVNINKAIVVDILLSNSASILEIAICVDVECLTERKVIREMNSTLLRIYGSKKRWLVVHGLGHTTTCEPDTEADHE